MLIERLPRFLRGYVIFELRGDNVEVFLNACAENKIDLFRIKRREDSLQAACLVRDYKQLRRIPLAGLRRRILCRRGIRFSLYRYRRRLGLAIGGVMMLAALLVLSGFVWSVDVSGNERLSENLILQTLQECGFREGVSKRRLQISEIENQMMMRLCDLSWIAINLDGSCAHVEVKERQMPPVTKDKSRPSDLVAAMDGEIVQMEIIRGKPIEKAGSGVVKGQLLVSGYYYDKKENVVLEHSDGKVWARCRVSRSFELPMRVEETLPREHKKFYALKLFERQIDLSFGKRPSAGFTRKDCSRQLSVFGLKLPFVWIESRYEDTQVRSVQRTEQEAKQVVMMEISHFEAQQLYEAKILEKHVDWRSDDETCRASVQYLVLIDIALQREIDPQECQPM